MHEQNFAPPPDIANPRLLAAQVIAEHPQEIRSYAELGVLYGDSTCRVAEALLPDSTLYLFDFHDMVHAVGERLKQRNLWGRHTVLLYGNSRRLRDSYNWSLMHIMRYHPEPLFDYVFLDGAHTYDVDGLALLLLDRLLRPGGYLELDDYDWYIGRSATQAPGVYPEIAEWYTEEQIHTPHVAKIAHLFLERGEGYEVVQQGRLYRKR